MDKVVLIKNYVSLFIFTKIDSYQAHGWQCLGNIPASHLILNCTFL